MENDNIGGSVDVMYESFGIVGKCCDWDLGSPLHC